MQCKEIELAWAAGFFDGEGYVGVYYDRRAALPKPKLQVSINQVNPEHLHRFRAAVGRLGNLTGPYKNGKWQPHFTYTAYGTAGITVMEMLAPYLTGEKVDNFEGAMETMMLADVPALDIETEGIF